MIDKRPGANSDQVTRIKPITRCFERFPTSNELPTSGHPVRAPAAAQEASPEWGGDHYLDLLFPKSEKRSTKQKLIFKIQNSKTYENRKLIPCIDPRGEVLKSCYLIFEFVSDFGF